MKAILNKAIHKAGSGSGAESVHLSKHIDLPFVPFPGLELWWGEHEQSMYSDVVRAVVYDVAHGHFKVYFHDVEEHGVMEAACDYMTYGWESSKEDFGTCPASINPT